MKLSLPTPSLFFLSLLLPVLVTARCTRRNNVSFAPTVHSLTSPDINNTAVNTKDNLPGIFPMPSPGISSLVPWFREDNTLWRYAPDGSGTLQQGYLQKNYGGALAGWLWVFGTPEEANREGNIREVDIGCTYEGRHFLIFGGGSSWRACEVPGGYSVSKPHELNKLTRET